MAADDLFRMNTNQKEYSDIKDNTPAYAVGVSHDEAYHNAEEEVELYKMQVLVAA